MHRNDERLDSAALVIATSTISGPRRNVNVYMRPSAGTSNYRCKPVCWLYQLAPYSPLGRYFYHTQIGLKEDFKNDRLTRDFLPAIPGCNKQVFGSQSCWSKACVQFATGRVNHRYVPVCKPPIFEWVGLYLLFLVTLGITPPYHASQVTRYH